MKTKKENSKILSTNLFPVVGIGASAGGLDAFKKLLQAIPENSGMAYVLVQHLDPRHESMLPELLQKITSIPVLEIADDIIVEPNHIYVIPSNKMMVANDGVLHLTSRSEKSENKPNLPIDLFFTSLAEVHQTHAIGVVLSGTASDGTLGLKAIKDHGGITFAQDEASAAYEGMPNSAIQAGVVDFILSPEKIPLKILAVNKSMGGDSDAEQILTQHDEDVFKQILSLLRIRKGTDFTYYKQTTIRRRILRRMALNKNEEPTAYLKYLRENKQEQDVLYQDLLIPVTSFFRDRKTFDNLCQTVFPHILKNKLKNEPIRIWVAGCSTGEEAYSIAICFKEFLGDQQERIQIFATDISEHSLAKARIGLYTKHDIAGLSPEQVKEFFTKKSDSYQVNKSVRDMCVFAVHNFLKDPPFGKMHFISCRNVLIYMEPYLQKKALTTFHYALNPKGFLLLGKSETIGSLVNLFASEGKNDKLFARKDAPGRFMYTTSQRTEQNFSDLNTRPKGETLRTDFQKAADDLMLSKYTPAGVVVNESMDIVHFRGNTGNYLEQAAGKPSHNLLKMAKEGLAFDLRTILHKAKKEKGPVNKENIVFQINGNLHNISIEAIPLPNIVEAHYLVLFHDNTMPASVKSKRPAPKPNSKKKNDEKDIRIKQLEKELAQTHEDMRSITEDQEAANEELQSANEELLSSSEELQSLNEELETSKEELQSTNEELIVVNHEIINLNEQVTEARNFAEAIVATVRGPLMVLDKNLLIKSANAAYYKSFQESKTETEGKLIYEVGSKEWDNHALRDLLEKILPEKSKFEDFEITQTFERIGKRVVRLSARELILERGSEKLILLAIEDITELKKVQEILRKSGEQFRRLVKGLSAAVYSCDSQGRITFFNDAAVKLWGRKPEIGKDVWCGSLKIFNPDGTILPADRCPMALTLKNGQPIKGQEITIERPDGIRSIVLTHPQLEFGLSGEVTGATNILIDVTEQVTATKKIKESEERFRLLAETLPQLVWVTDEKGKQEFASARWEEYTGVKPGGIDEWKAVVHPDDFENINNAWLQCMTTGNIFKFDARLKMKNGEYRWHTVNGAPIVDTENKTIKWVGAFTDTHAGIIFAHELEDKVESRTKELGEANQKLVFQNKEKEKRAAELITINKQLQSFSYVASHDLQEPLRKIQTFAKRILEKETETLSANGKDYFNRMQNAARRMQTLIEDLLAFSRVSTAERKFERADLNKIVDEVKIELKETLEEKNATIEATELCEVSIIPFQFTQLMHNLFSNALKFSKPNIPPHITIKSRIIKGNQMIIENPALSISYAGCPSPEKKYCHITVSDNGIGFDPKYKDQIFEVFQRLHGKDEYAGTGIGLAIVKKIVENHNGIITASSELNEGASFDIYIPEI